MSKSNSTVHDSVSFWNAFIHDLEHARGRVLIQSPFISNRRMSALYRVLKNLNTKNVTVCAFMQEPRNWHSRWSRLDDSTRERFEEIEFLRKELICMGVHVTLRPEIHEKIAVIDDSILWEGSLNILSHTNSSERMRRIRDREEVSGAINQHDLDSCTECCHGFNHAGSGTEQGLIDQLVEFRNQLNLSQSELASKCGLRQATISRMESELGSIRVSTLCSVANGLELEPVLVPKFLLPSLRKLLGTIRQVRE